MFSACHKYVLPENITVESQKMRVLDALQRRAFPLKICSSGTKIFRACVCHFDFLLQQFDSHSMVTPLSRPHLSKATACEPLIPRNIRLRNFPRPLKAFLLLSYCTKEQLSLLKVFLKLLVGSPLLLSKVPVKSITSKEVRNMP